MNTFEQTAANHASTSKGSLDSPPIEGFELSGLLSSVDSKLDLPTDTADPAEAKELERPAADSVSNGNATESAVSGGPPAKRKRGRPRKPSNAAADIVTTGAFMTRATLRKLGMAEVSISVDTIESVLSTGSKVKVLDIDKHWYTAIVLAISKGKVMVHYPGWDHSFNEWIPVDSRRLVYRGKDVGKVRGALEALKQLESSHLDAEDPELAGFDLADAINKAFPPELETDRKGKVLRTVDPGPSVKLDDSWVDANPRGRFKGSRNRRRVGHIKSRPRKSAAKKADPGKQTTPIDNSEPAEECEAPPIPAELRIPEIRLAANSDNPYARQHCLDEIFGSDSDEDTGTAMAKPESNLASSQSGNSTDKTSSIWHLTRGPYVTTGAFLTRRAIKSLTQSEATGGIMQEHHGYYPGQLVEVLNSNRKWYMGRVITYANKKFLVHYNGWNHSQNEWIAAGSKRLSAVRESTETEEEARKICVVLVDEYNAYIDEMEKKKAERAAAKRKPKPVSKPSASMPVAKPANNETINSTDPVNSGEDEPAYMVEDETDEDVEPISVDSGYTQVPQLLRVKDYVKLFYKGMAIAARDRNKLWWKAEIVGIKHFRLRVHYTGFSSYWDEWMEMNTQRIMLVSTDTAPTEQSNELSTSNSAAVNLGDTNDIAAAGIASQHLEQDAGESSKGKSAQPPKRLGRPPNPETKSTPLSLRLALKALESDRDMYEQCHPEELDVFHLPKEHMSMRDYSTFLKVGDRVRIRDSDKQWYECTIIDFRHCRIRVCFNGRSDEFNQWIPVNSDRIRVLRETIDGDKRLEKLERDSRIALRRKREKLRALRRKRSQVSVASLVRLAESLEYIVDQEEPTSGSTQTGANEQATSANGKDSEDQPLLQVMLEKDSDAFDNMPLMTRMMLTEHFNSYRLSSRVGHSGRTIEDSATWFVYCNLCNVVIRTFRYYCVSCEKPSDGYDYESYDLCLMCFSKSFPSDHPHPPTCFARSAVGDIDGVVQFTSNVLSKYRKQSLAANSDSSVDMFADVVAVYEPDEFDTSYNMPSATGNTWSKLAVGLHGTTTWMDGTGQSAVLGRIAGQSRRSHISDVIEAGDGSDKSDANGSNDRLLDIIPRCAFCGEEAVYERDILGGFAGDHPFILASTTEDGTSLRRRFWAHDACARYSPEVLVSDSGKWFNVAAALRRGRTIKCAICKRRGATVGCFHGRCQKSYHVMCTQKPKEFFEQGFTYWCPRHSRIASGGSRLGRDALDEEQHTARCANCNHELSGDLMWMTCLECPNEPKRQFNICLSCYDSKDALVNHPHKKRCFREHLSHAGGVSSTGKYLVGRAGPGRKPKNPAGCHYCRSRQSRRWRKGYGGVVMCETCFNTAHSLQGGSQDKKMPANTLYEPDLFADDNEGSGQLEVVALNPFGSSLVTTESGTQQQQQQPMQTSALVEDYAQSIYFTRETCIASNRIGMTSVSQQPLGQLSSYGPTDSMLFTLAVDSSYFDIPGRAPRWGSHSGTDYHGTWLPQTVRRALLRYTKRGDRVLSNFLGRGTDAIECFLLSRKCIGVDINPSAVALAQRNCSFTIMPDSGMSVEFRPAIMQGDARQLTSGLWPGATYFAEPESFDHILSHPPYKDCVLYSTNIEGDLSRFPGPEEFQREMEKVVSESWRLLRMGRHLTLGIGDNRAECFYIPVSYQLFRTYINYGFELEELIVKRQRYCQAFGLGTYLCVQFDFLMFTHEFIATLRKVPQNQVDRMHLTSEQYTEHKELGFHGHHTADSISAAGSMLNRLVSIKCRTLREVPPSPIARKSVVMGSVWTFEPHPVFLFSHLCMSRMVQRFGRDESNWEQIDLVLENKKVADAHVQLKTANAESGNHDDMSDSEPEFADNGTRAGGYELERQRQIQENREQLLHLGLVSELGEDSTDTAHYQKMVAMCPRLPLDATPLALIVVPHISNLEFKRCHVEPYRQALVQITHDASNRLCPSGLLVIGVQDVRDENGKLWPLGMLVLEDVQRAIGNIRLRLKEFIVVVENGHARKRDDVVSRETFVDEKCIVGVSNIPHVPIVHAYYLVFMKLK